MYINFKNYSVHYDEKKHSFSCYYRSGNEVQETPFIRNAIVSIRDKSGKLLSLDLYKKVEFQQQSNLDNNTFKVTYSGGSQKLPPLTLDFAVESKGLHVSSFIRGIVHIEGDILWGIDPLNYTYGVRLDVEDHHLRTAYGPTFSIHDNGLLDVLTDRVLEFKKPKNFLPKYDWKKKNYRFSFENEVDYGRNFSFCIHEDYYRKKFNIPYSPIDKRHEFKTPPVGWMTWYAVQFKADEQKVFENAQALANIFGEYSDQLCLWVDWEWNHKAFDGLGQKGVDTFTPRPEIYPHGLAYVAREIQKMGLIPALWIGATNDGQKNRLLQKHPEWVLAHKPDWCGQWWIDPSHPGVVKEYIPAIFKQILKWGYKAIKWDCLPLTLKVCDAFHSEFHNPTLSTDVAMRNVVKSARETIGPEIYMLSCSGETDRDITFAQDMFNAARIGGDIFGWEYFMDNSIDRVLKFYPWHNVTLYADADNLILRNEFNTPAQARSRTSFYGLTGLPVTIGDHLPDLSEDRIEMLKKVIPVTNIHPLDIQQKTRAKSYTLTNLSVCKEYGQWNVVDVFNTKDTPLDLTLSLESDLHINTRNGERYAVCSFWDEKFLGIYGDSLNVSIPPYDSAVLRITPLEDHPQIIFTSRHITQGAYDLESLDWNEKKRILEIKSRVTKGESSRLSVYIPKGYKFKKTEGDRGCEIEALFHPSTSLLNIEIKNVHKSGILRWKLFF